MMNQMPNQFIAGLLSLYLPLKSYLENWKPQMIDLKREHLIEVKKNSQRTHSNIRSPCLRFSYTRQ